MASLAAWGGFGGAHGVRHEVRPHLPYVASISCSHAGNGTANHVGSNFGTFNGNGSNGERARWLCSARLLGPARLCC